MVQIVWEMAEHFHWTLDYVESLPMSRLYEWIQISDGRSKGIAESRRRDEFLHKKRR